MGSVGTSVPEIRKSARIVRSKTSVGVFLKEKHYLIPSREKKLV